MAASLVASDAQAASCREEARTLRAEVHGKLALLKEARARAEEEAAAARSAAEEEGVRKL